MGKDDDGRLIVWYRMHDGWRHSTRFTYERASSFKQQMKSLGCECRSVTLSNDMNDILED